MQKLCTNIRNVFSKATVKIVSSLHIPNDSWYVVYPYPLHISSDSESRDLASRSVSSFVFPEALVSILWLLKSSLTGEIGRKRVCMPLVFARSPSHYSNLELSVSETTRNRLTF